MIGDDYQPSWVDDVDPHIAPHLESAALLIIDTQVDFVDEGASPIEGTSAVLPALAALCAAFRAAMLPVVHVVRLYEGEDVDRVRRTAIAAGMKIVAPGSRGSQVVPELRDVDLPMPDPARLLAGHLEPVGENEVVMWKPRWSAFHRTRLHRHLTKLGADTVVVAGCNFPNCPRATLYDASEHDYRVLVAADAISGLRRWHLDELSKLGVLHLDTDALIKRVRSLTTSSR